MKIIIETIEHKDQRYNTCGDWYWDEDGAMHVKVSRLPFHESTSILLVGVHELVEALLCCRKGISQQQVDEFDLHFTSLGVAEPGDHPDCPYRREHFMATTIERILAQHMNIDWEQYEREIEKLG